MSRINIKLKSNEETEINGQGPNISQEVLDKLFGQLNQLKDNDILVLAGSIPNTLPEDIYEKILKMLSGRKINVVVDATKDLLLNVLKYHPFLIKPNKHELGEMFGVELTTKDEIIMYAAKLQELGARNVVISMAAEGAIFITEDKKVYQRSAPKGKVVNSVGAGDSMVAGFITGYLQHADLEDAFKMGIATGSASAFSQDLATKAEVFDLLQKIE
jgi:1-phosphofructokinase